MEMYLNEKKIVVTASTDGIGYAIAQNFLEEGADVLINGRKEVKAKEIKEILEKKYGKNRVFLYVGDMAVESNIKEFRQYADALFDHIDCIVANLGSGKPIVSNNLDIKGWKGSFDINLFSAVQLIQSFDDFWDAQVGGNVVMVSSLAAYNRISAPYAYASAKHGISVFSKYLSDDYAKRKIRVNSVIPGNVYYEGGRWEELINKDEISVKNYIEQSVPLKRFAIPDEIAKAVVFLASDCASYITGATLLVDGGQSRSII